MKKRIIIVTLAILMVLSSLSACVEKIEETTPVTTTPVPTTPTPTTPAPTTPAPTTPAPTTPAPTTPTPTTPAPTTPAPTTPAPTTPAPTTPAPTTPAPTTPAPTTPAPTTPAPTTPAPTTPAVTTPADTTPVNPPVVEPTDYYKNPLTGEESTVDYLKLRPLAILISNQKEVLGTQCGISQADVIYEFLVEGGITRMMMLTYDYENISMFGPVRSAREYALDMAVFHDAITVHAGGNFDAYLKISGLQLDTLDGTNNAAAAEYFNYRSIGLPSYNSYMISGSNLVTAIEKVRGYYNQANIRTTSSPFASSYFTFSADGTFAGGTGEAKNISITYMSTLKDPTNVTTLTYDESTGTYLKYVDGVAQVDALNDVQLAFENVLILSAKTTRISSTALTIDMTSGGSGTYCNGGERISITWTYDAESGQPILTTTAGEPLEMATGKTHISIVSDGNGGVASLIDYNYNN
ncbi:MAG: DUF3048 domain-containing protein [Clostridia bacterium]|nr:DUF3048 domain-containing protein [Clostridia bacterium]